MKLSPYAEKLLSKASSPARPAIAAPGEAPGAQSSIAASNAPAWLKCREICENFGCSVEHVSNLVASAEIDVVIDISSDGASRASYRILATSVARFERLRTEGKQPPTDLEAQLLADAKTLPILLSADKTAAYLRCTSQHILDLASHFMDLSVPGSSRRCLRVQRAKLFAFIKERRVT